MSLDALIDGAEFCADKYVEKYGEEDKPKIICKGCGWLMYFSGHDYTTKTPRFSHKPGGPECEYKTRAPGWLRGCDKQTGDCFYLKDLLATSSKDGYRDKVLSVFRTCLSGEANPVKRNNDYLSLCLDMADKFDLWHIKGVSRANLPYLFMTMVAYEARSENRGKKPYSLKGQIKKAPKLFPLAAGKRVSFSLRFLKDGKFGAKLNRCNECATKDCLVALQINQ